MDTGPDDRRGASCSQYVVKREPFQAYIAPVTIARH
jgi:hypothetical protein